MPANYARFLVGRTRSQPANRQLGLALAFVAGAINAGGFLAVHQYTSHVTGMLSSLADNVALNQFGLVGSALVGVIAFLRGAACCAVMVNLARQRRLASEYALPLLLEALLVLCFGVLGPWLAHFKSWLVPLAVALLAFVGGGIAGAFGFKAVGYGFTVPIAAALALLAVVPMADDLRRRRRAKP
jgi:uncharacterized membrane protein YoaK (UPF0700 family)